MKRFNTPCLLALLALLAPLASGAAISPDVSLAPVVERTAPAVVSINTAGTVTRQATPFDFLFGNPGRGMERPFQGAGSGVIIDGRRGYVVTNNHVIDNADRIEVSLQDGRQFSAEVLGTDPDSDLALLKIDADKLPSLRLGDSDGLRVGDYVLAIGNPFSLGLTVTSGIVSAKARSLNGGQYEDFIQTDAAINRGNSGGALINLQGELVGINTAIIGPAGGNVGIGFAVPSRVVRAVIDQLVEHGEVRRGLIGIAGSDLSREVAEQLGLDRVRGALVTLVTPNMGAAEAGVKELDVILEADGRRINGFQDLRNVVGLKRPGETVRLKLWRNGKTLDKRVEIRPAPGAQTAQRGRGAQSGPEEPGRHGGLALAELDDEHPLHGSLRGVVVTGVVRDSAAARIGIQPGDVITSIDRRAVRNVAEAERLLAREGQHLLRLRRGQGAFVVVLDTSR